MKKKHRIYHMGVGSTVMTIARHDNGVFDVGLVEHRHGQAVGTALLDVGPATFQGKDLSTMRFASFDALQEWTARVLKHAQAVEQAWRKEGSASKQEEEL